MGVARMARSHENSHAPGGAVQVTQGTDENAKLDGNIIQDEEVIQEGGLQRRFKTSPLPSPTMKPVPGGPSVTMMRRCSQVEIAKLALEEDEDENGKPVVVTEEATDEERLLQIRLLAACRGMFQMSRICMGPLVVAMAQEYTYNPEEKGQILSAFAAGYALTQVAGGLAADVLGGAPLLLTGLITSGAALFVLPWAADAGHWHMWWLLWAMGLTQGPTYPAQLVTTAKWATGSLRGYASAIGGAGSTAGSLLALGITPIIATRVGWRATACFWGSLTLGFAVLWYCLGRSSPKRKVQSNGAAKSEKKPDSAVRPSWADQIIKSLRVVLAPSVLVIFVAHSIHNFVRYFLMAWMPTYYNEVLQVSGDAAGLQLILPELSGLLCSIGGATYGKSLQDSGTLSALGCRRVFASLAFAGGAMGLMGASLMSRSHSVTACLCLAQGLMTLQGLGFGANYLEISKHHSGLVTGVGNTVATCASFAAPVFAAWILSDEAATGSQRWYRLFVAFASSNLIGFAVFVPFCSTTPVDLEDGEDAPMDKKKSS